MKKSLSILFMLFISAIAFAQKIDSSFILKMINSTNEEHHKNIQNQLDNFNVKISSINSTIEGLQNGITENTKINSGKIEELRVDVKNYKDQIYKLNQIYKSLNDLIEDVKDKMESSTNRVEDLDKSLNNMESYTDSISSQVITLNKDLNTASKEIELEHQTNEANKKQIEGVSNSLSQKTKHGLIIAGFSIILILLVYLLMSRKWNKNTKEINSKQTKIFEKQIEDSQQITDWLSNEIDSPKPIPPEDKEIDHSFAKRVADEIVRITTNLSRMDESIKGYKQLKASVRKLEQSLNANQYEIEDMLNKAFVPGMNLQANFVIDDTLGPDESIITRIIKPQINYKGKLIQVAQVEVSQGE